MVSSPFDKVLIICRNPYVTYSVGWCKVDLVVGRDKESDPIRNRVLNISWITDISFKPLPEIYNLFAYVANIEKTLNVKSSLIL